MSIYIDIVKCTKNLFQEAKDKQEKKKNRELAEYGVSLHSSAAKSKSNAKFKAYDELSVKSLKKHHEQKDQDRLCDKTFIKTLASNATYTCYGNTGRHGEYHCSACFSRLEKTSEIFMCPDHKSCMFNVQFYTIVIDSLKIQSINSAYLYPYHIIYT